MKTSLQLFLCIVLSQFVSILNAQDIVRIAANLPLTGDLGTYGVSIQQGAILAAEDLRSLGKLKKQISFDWQDNRGDNKDAYSIMTRQTISRPDFYVSGLKPQTMTISDKVSTLGIPHFTWILDAVINPKSNNNFRVWVNFNLEAEAFLKVTETSKVKKIAMLYVQLPAAEYQYKKVLIPAFEDRGVKDILIEPYPLENSDLKSLALKLKTFKPDLIILNGFIPHLVQLVRELRKLHLIKDMNTLVSLDMIEAAELLTPFELEGIVVAAPLFITNSVEQKFLAWREKYKSRFGNYPSYHAAYAYDMVLSIAEAVNSRSNEASFLEPLKKVSIPGITGVVKFDQDGSSNSTMSPAVYRNGKLNLIAN